jgi:hypothetical protein
VLLAPTLHPDVRDPRGAGAGAAGAGDVGENRLLAWLGRGATELLQDLFLAPHGPALRARLAHGDCALGGAPGADAPAWRQALAALTALAAACSWAVAAPGSPSGSRSPGMRSGGVREEEEEGGWREAAAAAAAAWVAAYRTRFHPLRLLAGDLRSLRAAAGGLDHALLAPSARLLAAPGLSTVSGSGSLTIEALAPCPRGTPAPAAPRQRSGVHQKCLRPRAAAQRSA